MDLKQNSLNWAEAAEKKKETLCLLTFSFFLFFFLAQRCWDVLQEKIKNILGIIIDNIECKISQYADDSTVIVDGSNRSLLQTLETLDLFEGLYGLKVNEEKTNVVYIGSLANQMPNQNITQKKLKRVKDGRFKAFGVIFSVHLEKKRRWITIWSWRILRRDQISL